MPRTSTGSIGRGGPTTPEYSLQPRRGAVTPYGGRGVVQTGISGRPYVVAGYRGGGSFGRGSNLSAGPTPPLDLPPPPEYQAMNLGEGGFNMPSLFSQPFMPQNLPGQGGGSFNPGGGGSNVDQWLADLGNNMGYLEGMAEGEGKPIDVMPAWDASVAAMERNIQKRKADLTESFNVSGNRFSTAFGSSMADFENQANLEQNSLLANMMMSSSENARGRELAAGQGLAGYGFAGPSQLSSQNFQSQMQQQQQQLQASLAMQSGSDMAAMLMAQQGYGAGQQFLNNSMQASQNLWGAENQAAQGMFNAQNQFLPQYMGYDQNIQNMLMQGGMGLSGLLNQNQQTGLQTGFGQYGLDQNAINNQYQEWLRQQPTYNPLMPYYMQGATQYPTMQMPQYSPSQTSQMMQGFGNLIGLLPQLMSMFGN